jgi:hypothetical protein
MIRLGLIAALAATACVDHQEAKDFFDDAQRGSTWVLLIGPPQSGCMEVASKTGDLPAMTVAGCEPGCTCSFFFSLDDHGDNLGPTNWHVSAVLSERCGAAGTTTCSVEDADRNTSGSCGNAACSYSFSIMRQP